MGLVLSARGVGAGSALGEEVLTFVNGSVVMARATGACSNPAAATSRRRSAWHHEWCSWEM